MSTTLARLSRLTAEPAPAGDGLLLDAFLAGDQSAFALLVRRHAGLVFATCRRLLRHHQDAEDAFQATFLVLARRASDVWPREAVASWLFGVAHRVALKARGARNRRMQREQPLEDIACVESEAVDFDLVEAVRRVDCKLPEVYRAAVVACDLEGLSRKEAAERLGWSEGTLSGRLARARELLANRLRRLGHSLPATGLTAFAASEPASAAAIETTINLTTGAAGSASAPVSALTEGVVRSMALSKLKAMSAALLTACVLGLGAFAASGAGRGSGDEPGAQKVQPPVDTPPVAKPTEPSAKKPAGSVTDRDLLQGSWRVVSMTERGKTMRTYPEDPWMVEVRGSTLRMPYLEGGKAWKQREYSFTLQPAKQRPDAIEHPNTIDLYRSSAPLARGIYEFTVGLNPCASCHKPAGAELKPGETLTTYGAWELCDPGREGLLQSDYGVRLALSIDGKRPTKFGGDGVIVFNLARNKQSRWIGNPTVWEKFDTLDAELQILLAQVEHKLRNKRIDPLFGEQLRGRLEQMRWILEESRKASGIDNPTDPVAKAELAVLNARRNARRAEAEVEKAQSNVEAARLLHEKAKAELKAAGQHLAELKKPQTGTPANEGETFGVHIRTLKVAEKVIRVKATGKQTVLEGLVHAADDVAIKSDAVSVWVVRDGAVLPVDLPAILKGDAKTNHTIKPGDRLFVQAKPGK